LALAQNLDLDLPADLRLRHETRQPSHGRHVLAVEFDDHVAVLDARLGGGALLRDALDTSAPVASFNPFTSGQVLGDGLHIDTEPAAARLAVEAQLLDDDGGGIRTAPRTRYRPRKAGGRDDRRIHADDLAVHVEQRPAGLPLLMAASVCR
jgi:hypothetical protein